MQTLVLVKPCAIHRNLIGEIISRFERRGFTITAMKLVMPNDELVREHYKPHSEREFYTLLVETMANRPVVAMIVEGSEAVDVVRRMIGEESNCRNCSPGTIRGDLGLSARNTVVHGSDSEAQAEREIALWFEDSEIHSYRKVGHWCVHTGIDPE